MARSASALVAGAMLPRVIGIFGAAAVGQARLTLEDLLLPFEMTDSKWPVQEQDRPSANGVATIVRFLRADQRVLAATDERDV
jgi:hypothetical protein